MARPSLSIVSPTTAPSAGIEYELFNTVGRLVFTTSDISIARREARRRAKLLGGELRVESVQIIRRQVFTARPKLEVVV